MMLFATTEDSREGATVIAQSDDDNDTHTDMTFTKRLGHILAIPYIHI
jgi:hypothetical protein